MPAARKRNNVEENLYQKRTNPMNVDHYVIGRQYQILLIRNSNVLRANKAGLSNHQRSCNGVFIANERNLRMCGQRAHHTANGCRVVVCEVALERPVHPVYGYVGVPAQSKLIPVHPRPPRPTTEEAASEGGATRPDQTLLATNGNSHQRFQWQNIYISGWILLWWWKCPSLNLKRRQSSTTGQVILCSDQIFREGQLRDESSDELPPPGSHVHDWAQGRCH